MKSKTKCVGLVGVAAILSAISVVVSCATQPPEEPVAATVAQIGVDADPGFVSDPSEDSLPPGRPQPVPTVKATDVQTPISSVKYWTTIKNAPNVVAFPTDSGWTMKIIVGYIVVNCPRSMRWLKTGCL